jgi:hypothetical protein
MAARDLPIACEALDARDTEKPFGRAEFDKWIGDFDVSESVIGHEELLTRTGGLRRADEPAGQGTPQSISRSQSRSHN